MVRERVVGDTGHLSFLVPQIRVAGRNRHDAHAPTRWPGDVQSPIIMYLSTDQKLGRLTENGGVKASIMEVSTVVIPSISSVGRETMMLYRHMSKSGFQVIRCYIHPLDHVLQ